MQLQIARFESLAILNRAIRDSKRAIRDIEGPKVTGLDLSAVSLWRSSVFCETSCALQNFQKHWPGPSADMCREFLLCKFWRILPGIFLEDFFGDFFPTKMRRKNPATKSAKKSGGPKIKIREKSVLPKTDPNPDLLFLVFFCVSVFFPCFFFPCLLLFFPCYFLFFLGVFFLGFWWCWCA